MPGMSARQIVAWSLVVVLILFVVFNLDPARIWLFGIKVEMPIGLVVIISALLGSGATGLFTRLKTGGKAR